MCGTAARAQRNAARRSTFTTDDDRFICRLERHNGVDRRQLTRTSSWPSEETACLTSAPQLSGLRQVRLSATARRPDAAISFATDSASVRERL
jgi:hypothetical protein